MGTGYRNIFVCFESCASPLCPFDLLPSPKMRGNQCTADYPPATYPYPAAPAACPQRATSAAEDDVGCNNLLDWNGQVYMREWVTGVPLVARLDMSVVPEKQ